MTEIRTRFAPSPTGYMHIGGMRTALFNWLWARHHNGKFILRIDDTDRERNLDEALEPILNAFRWMGLDWDEGPEVGGDYGPYFQSQRQQYYTQAAQQLLAQGKAFRDFDTPETVKADRESAEKEKQNYLNIRRSLELSERQIADFLAEGRPHVVRFLVPREEKIAIDDIVRGHVEWDCSLIPDPVILRNDGTPLYNFATVLDDANMKISHVIRAEEHLSNTSVQGLIHIALGHELPVFAHIPYVAAPGTKEKLSKREKKIEKYKTNPVFRGLFRIADEVFPRVGLGTSQTLNPVMVEYYEKAGFLSDAVFNSLARLGWSLDDKTEFMTRETVVNNFTLDRVIKSPAGLDPDKLMSLQAEWMNQLSTNEKIAGCLPFLVGAKLFDEPTAGKTTDDTQMEYLRRVIQAVGERLKIFSDILTFDDFFIADEMLEYDEKAFQKRLRNAPESVELLERFKVILSELETFDVASTEKALHDFAEQADVKIGAIIHALRVAVTGKPKGPGMFESLAVLGQDRSVRRIENALSKLELRNDLEES